MLRRNWAAITTPLIIKSLVDSSRIGMSALALGVCQAVLDYVVPYTNERVAFDEPISNRQSVAFMIADMAIETRGLEADAL